MPPTATPTSPGARPHQVLAAAFTRLAHEDGALLLFVGEQGRAALDALCDTQGFMLRYFTRHESDPLQAYLLADILTAGSGAQMLAACFLSLHNHAGVDLGSYGCLDTVSRYALLAMLAAYIECDR